MILLMKVLAGTVGASLLALTGLFFLLGLNYCALACFADDANHNLWLAGCSGAAALGAALLWPKYPQ